MLLYSVEESMRSSRDMLCRSVVGDEAFLWLRDQSLNSKLKFRLRGTRSRKILGTHI